MFLLFYNSKSQENKFFTQEQELSKLGEIILNGETDSIRYEANNKFKKILIDLLNTKKSYKYKFGKIAPLSIITPKNKKFKFFSWFIPLTNGKYDYYGLIQTHRRRQDESR